MCHACWYGLVKDKKHVMLIVLSGTMWRLQGSVWGSGSAGTLCAIVALATGNADFWQVSFTLFQCSKLAKSFHSPS